MYIRELGPWLTGVILPSREYLAVSEHIFRWHSDVVLLASSETGMLLQVLESTGKPPPNKELASPKCQ